MKKVLLATESPEKKELYINTLPPLGILGIASYLESKGIQTDVIDNNIQKVDYFDVEKYDTVGFSVHCANVSKTLKSIENIKKNFPDKKIIVGGPHILIDPENYIKNENIDAVIVGEGELAVYDYIKNKGNSKHTGLYLKNSDGEIKFNGMGKWITDLDSLPFPALDKVDIKKYDVPLKQKKPISNIMSSRGCPFSCIFCFHSLGKVWRARSAKNFVDEVEWQVNNFGVKEICIFDDNFTLDIKRVNDICDGIIERGINVKFQFTNGVRVDRVNKELLIKLKKAGVWLMGIAPESGNLESLEKMKKQFDLKRVEDVAKWCKEIGLFTHSYFMVGFPWESREHIEQTIDFARKLDTDVTQFSRVIPFPKTELYDMIGKENINVDYTKDVGLFYGNVKHKVQGLSEEEIQRLIKKGYRQAFLRPKKMINLLIKLHWIDLFKLAKYSFISDSM